MTFEEWFSSKQGEAYDSMYCFARDAWKAAQDVEREECAKVCMDESMILLDGYHSEHRTADNIAKAIRTRGEK